MAHDSALVERIVASVLEQLQSRGVPRVESPVPAVAPLQAEPKELGLTDAVVTAAVLEHLTIPGGATLLVGPKTVLTPSAHDWLRQRQVAWKRSRTSVTSAVNHATRWQLLASTVTPTVRSLLDQVSRSHASWKRQLVGTAAEATETAVRSIATAETERVFVITSQADMVACRANRNDRVRAAVIQSAEHLRGIEANLSPNVVVLDPQAKSLMELRQIVQACAVLSAPRAPIWK